MSHITLVIPVFNRQELVCETIEAALRQNRKFEEIIVVNDGSTDGTRKALTSFGTSVRAIHTANLGVQNARNLGVFAAKTKYVALCDSDDLLRAEFVDATAKCLEMHPDTEVMYSNFVNFSSSTTSRDKLSQAPAGFFNNACEDSWFIHQVPDLYARLMEFQPLFSSGLMIKKAFYEKLRGYDVSLRGVGAEDFEFTLRAACYGKLVICKSVLAEIRRHEKNDSADSLRMLLGEIKILNFAKDKHECAKHHQKTIACAIARRKSLAFRAAFAQGDFQTALILGPEEFNSQSKKDQIKYMICRLPWGIRHCLWKISQIISAIHIGRRPDNT